MPLAEAQVLHIGLKLHCRETAVSKQVEICSLSSLVSSSLATPTLVACSMSRMVDLPCDVYLYMDVRKVAWYQLKIGGFLTEYFSPCQGKDEWNDTNICSHALVRMHVIGGKRLIRIAAIRDKAIVLYYLCYARMLHRDRPRLLKAPCQKCEGFWCYSWRLQIVILICKW